LNEKKAGHHAPAFFVFPTWVESAKTLSLKLGGNLSDILI
jgi:hypothetical protein